MEDWTRPVMRISTVVADTVAMVMTPTGVEVTGDTRPLHTRTLSLYPLAVVLPDMCSTITATVYPQRRGVVVVQGQVDRPQGRLSLDRAPVVTMTLVATV